MHESDVGVFFLLFSFTLSEKRKTRRTDLGEASSYSRQNHTVLLYTFTHAVMI